MRAAAIAIVVSLLTGTVPANAQTTYFPLEVDNQWTYAGITTGAEMTFRVIGRDGDQVVLDVGPLAVRLLERAAEISIELPGESFVSYYHFDQDSWLHRDYLVCEDGRSATVLSRDAVVVTPAGEFHDCLEVAFGEYPCTDAGKVREWWAAGVGLVKWEETTLLGESIWELQTYEVVEGGDSFLRGDCNSDGDTSGVTDAIFHLSFNFLDAAPPSCRASCDTNGDGQTSGVTDAIYQLNYNFLGGSAPVSPFPQCGRASRPSDRDLGCNAGPAGC